MLRAVFFDAESTLFEPREPIGETYARFAARFGLKITGERLAASFHRAFAHAPGLAFGVGLAPERLRTLERQWWRERVAETFDGIGRPDDFDAYFDELFAYFAAPARWQAKVEAASVLKRLKQSGLALGVISNFDHRLYAILDGLGLLGYLGSATISSEAGYAKPRREVFETALAKHGLAAGEALHVGDSMRMDMEGAAGAGMAAVLIEATTGEQIVISGRTARISSLASVLEVAQRFKFD